MREGEFKLPQRMGMLDLGCCFLFVLQYSLHFLFVTTVDYSDADAAADAASRLCTFALSSLTDSIRSDTILL